MTLFSIGDTRQLLALANQRRQKALVPHDSHPNS